MHLLVALGLSIGVLAGLWTEASVATGLITWVAFVAWAAFYAAGGKKEGLIKLVPANLLGVVWGILAVYFTKIVVIPYALGIGVAIAVFLICIQAYWKVLSFIPGCVIGFACYFGSNFDWKGTVIALVLGAVLGFISEWLAIALTKLPFAGRGKKENLAKPAP
jgi:hypothetical protein